MKDHLCFQCDRPLGSERYRRRLKDDKPIHVTCLEYVMRETTVQVYDPVLKRTVSRKAAHDLTARARERAKFTKVLP